MATLDAIMSALKDLLKYKIVAYVNTGDKTFDNLLNTFLLSIVTTIFGLFSAQYFIMKYRMGQWKRRKDEMKLDKTTYEYYLVQATARLSEFMFVTWVLGKEGSEGRIFGDKLGAYYVRTVGWRISNKYPSIFNVKTGEIIDSMSDSSSLFGVISKTITDSNIVPIYIYDGEIIGLTKVNGNLLIAYTSEKAYKIFIDLINKINIPDKKNEEKKKCSCEENPDENGMRHQCVCDCYNNKNCSCDCNCVKKSNFIPSIKFLGDKDTCYSIYTDRTLDMIVTRHKQKIVSLLDNFIQANKEKSRYNGYGSYNLGMILYGRPGTGKTMMIKAICNYLSRDAYIIDMRKIKTKEAFSEILLNRETIDNNVFIFDEFDCVQDVIKIRGTNNTDEVKMPPRETVAQLKERQLQLLSILSTKDTKIVDDKTKKKEDCPIQMELNAIAQEIKDRENALTLDTMLTILDGVVERRNRVVIATTNHIDQIDSALLRDGRFDIRIELDRFDNNEAHELLEKIFLNDATPEELEYLRNTKIREHTYVPVEIINLAVTHKSLRKVVDIMKEQEE